MRHRITTLLLAGALAAVPIGAFAAQAGKPAAQPAAKHASTKAATHATMGVVKSVDDNMLVITRSGKDAGDMSFGLNSSTQRKGTIAVGTAVSVRYHDDGATHMATAITAQPQKSKGTPKH